MLSIRWKIAVNVDQNTTIMDENMNRIGPNINQNDRISVTGNVITADENGLVTVMSTERNQQNAVAAISGNKMENEIKKQSPTLEFFNFIFYRLSVVLLHVFLARF